MNRLFSVAFFFFAFVSGDAQPLNANDSATTGFNNSEMTFYSLNTGAKTTVVNNDWHIALSVRPSEFPSNTLQGTTIRLNGGIGVKAYQIPGFTPDSFSLVVDTLGYKGWQRLYDSDTSLDEGALNTGYNIGVFFYGWGAYGGAPNHDVEGTKVYLFELPGGHFKKFCVEQLDRDTAWVLKVAELNNSNQQTLRISKAPYAGKNLVYLNLLDNSVKDKEPLASDWQLLFLKYAANDVEPGESSAVVGVLANKGVVTARRENNDVRDNDYITLAFTSAMNTIGWNWKRFVNDYLALSGKNFDQFTAYFKVLDSLTYFVKAKSGDVFKIVFTRYNGVSDGMISFYKEDLSATTTGMEKHTNENTDLMLYPNPTNGVLNVRFGSPTSAVVRVHDIAGKLITERHISEGLLQLNTSDYSSGVYVMSVTNGSSFVMKKFHIAH